MLLSKAIINTSLADVLYQIGDYVNDDRDDNERQSMLLLLLLTAVNDVRPPKFLVEVIVSVLVSVSAQDGIAASERPIRAPPRLSAVSPRLPVPTFV